MANLDTSRPDWWRSAVVYQIYPRSFADSDGDGIGDLRGIIDRLDYLAALEIDVLWISPFYRSPMADNGYDISDYTDVDPMFGTLADVDELIAGLHERGIRLMIDVVINHTSDEHPWFIESRSAREHPKRDWYWWRPARPGTQAGRPGAEPTNWMTHFSETAWEYDPATEEYYLHLFARQQPDLNWENPAVRDALYEMLRWWLQRGVDGFRLDVINLVSKRLPLVDGPAVRDTGLGDAGPSTVCGPRIHEFMQEFNERVIAAHPLSLITVGEMPGVSTEDALRFSHPASRELNMVFQFEHVEVDHGPGGRYDPLPFDLVALKEVLGRWQTELADGWNSLYWDNHDQPRAVSRFGCDDEVYRELSAKTLATVLHLLRGTPYIYQGEELGMTNYPFETIADYDDIETRNYFALATAGGADPARVLAALARQSRDHARTPMHWDDTAHAGFTTGTPWLPVNPNHVEINAELQVHDPHSVFSHYRRLIRLRHEQPVVVSGDVTMLAAQHPSLFAFTRARGDQQLLVLANFSTEELDAAAVPTDLGDARDVAEQGDLILGNYADGDAGYPATSLRPWESRVYLANRPAADGPSH